VNRRALEALAIAVMATVAGIIQDRAAPAADAKRTLVLVLALLGLSLVVARKRAPSARSIGHPAWTCALGFLALSALSALWGLPSGRLDLATWVGGATLALTVRSRGLRTTILAARGTALGLGTITSLWTTVSWARGLRGLALHGGQGNPNWLGLLLAVTLPLSLEAACAWREHPRGRTLAALGATLQLWALWMSHSRVAWIAATLAVLVLVAAARAQGTSMVRRWIAAAVAVLAVALAVASIRASSSSLELPSSEPASAEATPLDSLRGRLFLARVSARAAVHAAPFGVGLGGFGHAYLAAQGEVLGTMAPREASRRFLNATTAHDEWLQVAIESGPLALALLAGCFGFGIVALHRRGLHGGSASLVACAVCALGDSPLRQPAIAVVVALVLAAIPGRLRARSAAIRRPREQQRMILEGALLLACALLLSVSVRSWLSARLRTAAIEAQPADRLALLGRSARIDPGSGESALDLGLARLEAGDPDGALVELMRARRLMANMGTSIAIGNAELALDRPDLAEVSYREALSFHPGSMRARTNLADALRRLGRFDEADREAAVALQLSPGDARIQALIDRIHLERMDAATQ
jgi:tetratricopeptide (TPR) repeat protein